MSVPFSNTHLRVPQGFGSLLEGLTREILRHQPEDITDYAAQYFETLLKQREESGMDPAEWAAKLEDRFYNNQSFKTTRQPSPEKDSTTDTSSFKEKLYESQTEDESSNSAEVSYVSTTQPTISNEVKLMERTEEEEEKLGMSLERRLSEDKLDDRLPGADLLSDDLSGVVEEREPTINKPDHLDRESNENESSSFAGQDMPPPDLETTDFKLFSGVANVDVYAQELGTGEDQEDDEEEETAVVDNEILSSEEEENAEVETPVEGFSYSGLATVDVCATELGGTERIMDRATNSAHGDEEKSLKVPPEEALVQLSLSQSETEDLAEITKPEEETENEAPYEEMCEGLAHIEGNLESIDITKHDSLLEMSFEDEATAVATGQIISGTQDGGLEMDEAEKEINSEVEEMESHHDASEIVKGKMDTNESYLNHSDEDEKGEGVKDISSSHQPTTEENEENPESETDNKNEDNKSMSEYNLHQNRDFEKHPNFKEDEATDTSGEEKENTHIEGYGEMEEEEINDEENLLPHLTTDGGAFEASEQHLPEENDESMETLPKDTKEEEEEELAEEDMVDPEMQVNSDAVCEEESIGLTHREDGTVADYQEEEKPLGSEKATTEPDCKSSDTQEECSRPQEEEDIMDIPLDDPEANRAAAKIQAGFRGHMTRKKMKPEDKAEGEEVSSTGDVLNGSQGDTETGGSGAVERDDTSVPEQ